MLQYSQTQRFICSYILVHPVKMKCLSTFPFIFQTPQRINPFIRQYSNQSNYRDDEDITSPTKIMKNATTQLHKRVWKSRSTDIRDETLDTPKVDKTFWDQSISEMDNETIHGILERIGMQVRGKMYRDFFDMNEKQSCTFRLDLGLIFICIFCFVSFLFSS